VIAGGWLAQLLGVAGLAGLSGSLMLRRRAALLVMLASGQLCFAGHFLLINRQAGAVMMLLAMVRTLTSLFILRAWVAWSFVALSVAVTLPMIELWYDILPALAVSLGTLGVFQADTARMRLLLGGAVTTWLIHNALAGSLPGVIAEGVGLACVTVGYLRAEWLPRRRARLAASP